jgi:hypothetical protein
MKSIALVLVLLCFSSPLNGLNLNNRPSKSKNILSKVNTHKVIGGTLLSLLFYGPMLTSTPASLDCFKVNAAESIFVGKYSDPFHPGCLRKIDESKNEIVITGSDDPKASKIWVIKAKSISPVSNYINLYFIPYHELSFIHTILLCNMYL